MTARLCSFTRDICPTPMSLSKPVFGCAGSSSSGFSSGSVTDSSASSAGRLGSPISSATALKIYKKIKEALSEVTAHFESLVGDRATSSSSDCLIGDARDLLAFYETAWSMMDALRRADMQLEEKPVITAPNTLCLPIPLIV